MTTSIQDTVNNVLITNLALICPVSAVRISKRENLLKMLKNKYKRFFLYSL